MFIRDFAVSVVVGFILLLALSTAFWCSLIGHSFVSVIGIGIGYILPNHLLAGLVIAVSVGCIFQTGLFQIAVRAKSGTLVRWRAFILSLIVVLGDFFIASPLIEFWVSSHT